MEIEDTLIDIEQKTLKAASGPYRECGRERGGCICGQVWSITADALLATADNGDDDNEGFTDEQMKANAAFLATVDPETIKAFIRITRAAAWAKEAHNSIQCPDTQCERGAIPLGPNPDGYWEWTQCEWCAMVQELSESLSQLQQTRKSHYEKCRSRID